LWEAVFNQLQREPDHYLQPESQASSTPEEETDCCHIFMDDQPPSTDLGKYGEAETVLLMNKNIGY
jgi:hypothetical protein